jgi:hypothetical protein
VPWRFSDAGRQRVGIDPRLPASENLHRNRLMHCDVDGRETDACGKDWKSGWQRSLTRRWSTGHLELLFDLSHERPGQAGLLKMAEVLKYRGFPRLSVAELLAAILQVCRPRFIEAAEKH